MTAWNKEAAQRAHEAEVEKKRAAVRELAGSHPLASLISSAAAVEREIVIGELLCIAGRFQLEGRVDAAAALLEVSEELSGGIVG